MEKNILYLSYDGMTDPLGQSQVLPYLEGLSKEGYRFTLISFEKPSEFLKHENTISAICTKSNIDWIPLQYTKQPPILSTIKDIFTLRRVAVGQHKKKKFVLVHCRSYLTSLVGLHLKKRFGVKFLFDMRGFWADERVDGEIWKLSNPVYKFVYNYFKNKERYFLESADYVISLTHKAKSIIHEWQHLKNQPISIAVIPCCADLDLFDRSKLDLDNLKALQKDLDLKEDTFVLTYLGSTGTWYMLDEMLDYFSVLLSYKPNAKFLFVTRDNPRDILEKASVKKIPSSSILIKSATRKEVPYYIALSNFSIFFILPVFSKSASSPTKQGEIMAMGIPIICNSGVGDTDKVIQDYQAGVLINQFTPKAYEASLQVLDQIWNEDLITKGSREFYALEEGVNRYNQVYQALVM